MDAAEVAARVKRDMARQRQGGAGGGRERGGRVLEQRGLGVGVEIGMVLWWVAITKYLRRPYLIYCSGGI